MAEIACPAERIRAPSSVWCSGAQHRDHRPALGLAVRLVEAGAGKRLAGQRQRAHRNRRAAVTHRPETRQVVASDVRVGHQHLDHGWDDRDPGRTPLLHGLEEQDRIEARKNDARIAEHRAGNRIGRPDGVKHRCSDQHHLVGPEVERGGPLQRVGDQPTVGQHHPLGVPGGATGVDQHRHIVDARARIVDRAAAHRQRIQANEAGRRFVADHHEVLHVRQRRPDLRHPTDVGRIDDENARARVEQQVADLGRREPRVERHHDRTSRRDGEQQLEVTDAVVAE